MSVRMIPVTRLLAQVVVVTLFLAEETMLVSRVTLVQQQACSQAPDTAQVVCRCPGEPAGQDPAYLGVRMQGFLTKSQVSLNYEDCKHFNFIKVAKYLQKQKEVIRLCEWGQSRAPDTGGESLSFYAPNNIPHKSLDSTLIFRSPHWLSSLVLT